MISPTRSLLRRALDLFTLRLVLEQIGLGLLVLCMFLLWLRIPDASAMDVLGSVLLGVFAVAVAGTGESALMLRLCGVPWTSPRLIRGALILAVAVALWFGWSLLLERVEVNNGLRAGYLNSRFPHSRRNVFSYAHILLWLGWLGAMMRNVGAGVLAIVAFAAIASVRPVRTMMRALRSGTYWVVLIVGAMLASVTTGALLDWTPGHGVSAEMLSLILRAVIVVVLDGAVVSLLLAIQAACVRETDYATPAGTFEDSQPRTAGIP